MRLMICRSTKANSVVPISTASAYQADAGAFGPAVARPSPELNVTVVIVGLSSAATFMAVPSCMSI